MGGKQRAYKAEQRARHAAKKDAYRLKCLERDAKQVAALCGENPAPASSSGASVAVLDALPAATWGPIGWGVSPSDYLAVDYFFARHGARALSKTLLSEALVRNGGHDLNSAIEAVCQLSCKGLAVTFRDPQDANVLSLVPEADLRTFLPPPSTLWVTDEELDEACERIVRYLRKCRGHSAFVTVLARDLFSHSWKGGCVLRRALDRGIVWADDDLPRPLQVVTLEASLCFPE
jgi:hypothetical protein